MAAVIMRIAEHIYASQTSPEACVVVLCRWEAHIWVKELGRQVYLGGYEHEEHAAEAYDVAALKCKGFRVKTNFDADRYAQHSFPAWLMMHQCAVLLHVCTNVGPSTSSPYHSSHAC